MVKTLIYSDKRCGVLFLWNQTMQQPASSVVQHLLHLVILLEEITQTLKWNYRSKFHAEIHFKEIFLENLFFKQHKQLGKEWLISPFVSWCKSLISFAALVTLTLAIIHKYLGSFPPACFQLLNTNASCSEEEKELL